MLTSLSEKALLARLRSLPQPSAKKIASKLQAEFLTDNYSKSVHSKGKHSATVKTDK